MAAGDVEDAGRRRRMVLLVGVRGALQRLNNF
jgi:hypothetical protein